MEIIGKLTYRRIFLFWGPLALTSLLSLGVHPLVTFFPGRSTMAVESLAVLPVVNSLVFIFRSPGLSYQEVVVAASMAFVAGKGMSTLFLMPRQSAVIKRWMR